ncbi:hypothetical protein KPH14_011310 [Odynerus spinipes]|uniref:Uncharacterized protein n=1 Tax=Odynerus spinipes TaxID=1348599 RepID=A0AAD9RA46_9HYME|nr:hypothetical protein KPH14_011310 [Odynerus spinipes]
MSHLNLPLSDKSVQKYLDHLSDAYRKHSWNENNFSKIINVRSIANSLEERINIKEDLKQLQDLENKNQHG